MSLESSGAEAVTERQFRLEVKTMWLALLVTKQGGLVVKRFANDSSKGYVLFGSCSFSSRTIMMELKGIYGEKSDS